MHGDTHVPYKQIVEDLQNTIDSFVQNPKVAAALCGCVMGPHTFTQQNQLRFLAQERGFNLLRDATCYVHPEFPNAATATPMLVELTLADSDVYRQEYFGPMAFIIRTPSANEALAQAGKDAQECGSISNYAYSQHAEFLVLIEETFFNAG